MVLNTPICSCWPYSIHGNKMIKKIIKRLLIITALIGIAIALAVIYFLRPRTIDFTQNIPSELYICGEKIDENSDKYQTVYNWLKEHQKPWYNVTASYIPNYMYKGKSFTMNVFETGVIINANTPG